MIIFYGKQQDGGSNQKKNQNANEVNKEIDGKQLFYWFKS